MAFMKAFMKVALIKTGVWAIKHKYSGAGLKEIGEEFGVISPQKLQVARQGYGIETPQ